MTGQVRGSAPHFVDVHVGRRVRALRKQARLPLCALAQRIGVTYQQLQKYETGVNRMTSATLYEICQALGAPISSLFAGLAEAEPPLAEVSRVDAVLASPGGRDLIEAFLGMPTNLRRQYAALAKLIVDPAEPAPALRRPAVAWAPPRA